MMGREVGLVFYFIHIYILGAKFGKVKEDSSYVGAFWRL